MPDTIVQEEAFEKAQDRAREERLRKAVERELTAHRSLCQHYNKAIERIVELEEQEGGRISALEEEVLRRKQEAESLRAVAKQALTRSRMLTFCFFLTLIGVFVVHT